ncbi:uncharacterized protein LOC128960170 [Oppia nitens]|uniref:uncharacterized protein LOC128960170 n=1 Tax=Oppia nitens TaxID=1686743 RepID=UPI0023D9847D|nr:uncharacterized protein LOC128960170 [Oppia nitens]
MSLSTVFYPWATQYWHLWLCGYIYGFSCVIWDGTNNVVLIEMWKHRSPSMLVIGQLLWSVGSIVGPVMMRGYVIGNDVCPGVTQKQCETNHTYVETNSRCTEWCLNYDRRPQLKIPFLIGGSFELLGPTCYFIMFFIYRYRYVNDESVNENQLENTKEEDEDRRKKYIPKWTLLVCSTLLFSCGTVAEVQYTSFADTFFQYQPVLHLSASKSTLITATISGASSFGRVIGIFVYFYIRPQHVILVEVIITLVGLVFQILGQNQLILLWISSVIISLGFSITWISTYSFLAQYIKITDRLSGWIVGPCAIPSMVLSYFISSFMETNPSILLYICTTGVTISLMSISVANYAVRKVPRDLILNVKQQ